MRLVDLIEAPVSDITAIGDWTDPNGRFVTDDPQAHKYVRNPKYYANVKRVWERTPYDFKIYFINKDAPAIGPGTGVFDPKVAIQKHPELEYSFKPNPNGISLVYFTNFSNDNMPLTPWMLAHRFTHSMIPLIGSNSDGTTLQKALTKFMTDFVDEAWTQVYNNRYGGSFPVDKFAIVNAIMTTRAARENKILNEFDMVAECMAQYLITGKIRFNPLPLDLPTPRYGGRTRVQNPDQQREFNEKVIPRLEEYANMNIGLTLKSLVGKVCCF